MKLIIFLVIITLLVGYGIWAIATVDRRADDVRITSILNDTAASVSRRDVGGTVDSISENYKDDNGMNYDRLRIFRSMETTPR
jgi:hypothetical protein